MTICAQYWINRVCVRARFPLIHLSKQLAMNQKIPIILGLCRYFARAFYPDLSWKWALFTIKTVVIFKLKENPTWSLGQKSNRKTTRFLWSKEEARAHCPKQFSCISSGRLSLVATEATKALHKVSYYKKWGFLLETIFFKETVLKGSFL